MAYVSSSAARDNIAVKTEDVQAQATMHKHQAPCHQTLPSTVHYLERDLVSVIQHKVHVLVEPNDTSFYS